MDLTKIDKEAIAKDALRKGTPVAKKVAVHRMNNEGKTFPEVEDEFLNIFFIESRLYSNLKDALANHIRRHGLDMKSLELFNEFMKLQYFDKNKINAVLGKIRRAYVQDQQNRNLQYLIAKINEYLHKVSDFGKTAYDMVMHGKTPDLDIWTDKMLMQDVLFEENKEFLKQTLHHLRILEQNKVQLGIADLRMLLYHKDGCRREKLYNEVEIMIINIYNQLGTEDKREIYPEICNFVAEIVPEIGYISAIMVDFISSHDYISQESRKLLCNIKHIVTRLGMTPLIVGRLKKYYDIAEKNLQKGILTDTDDNVLAIIHCYCSLPEDVATKWEALRNK